MKKKSTDKTAKATETEIEETGEDLRSRILARLQADNVELDTSTDLSINDDAVGEEDQHSLAEKIQARLASLHKAVETPEKGDGSAQPPPVPGRNTPKTKDEKIVALQARFRGILIRREQSNLLNASVKLLRVQDTQWVVEGQGVANIIGGTAHPYVLVEGWSLDQRAWNSTKETLLEQDIDWMHGPVCECDEAGPPIYVLEQDGNDNIFGLEFALRGDEKDFEEQYEEARQDAAIIRIQKFVRKTLDHWKKHGKPEKLVKINTPAHHPPIGGVIQVRRGILKKKKIGKLVDFNNFTGQYKVEYEHNGDTKWFDLDKTPYVWLNKPTETTETETETEAVDVATNPVEENVNDEDDNEDDNKDEDGADDVNAGDEVDDGNEDEDGNWKEV